MGNGCGAQHAECVHGLPPPLFELMGDLFFAPAFTLGLRDDVVVDIGDVRDRGNVEPGKEKVAAQHVEDQGESAVAQVGKVVDRRATDVHRHLPGVP